MIARDLTVLTLAVDFKTANAGQLAEFTLQRPYTREELRRIGEAIITNANDLSLVGMSIGFDDRGIVIQKFAAESGEQKNGAASC